MLLNEKDYKKALASLKKAYPNVRPALIYETPFELLVSTMLAAQCTDRQVNKVTAVLYPLYNTPEQFSKLTVEELEPYIHSCGFFHSKAKNIIAMSKILCDKYGGEVPRDRDLLTTLPGVGRKTANVVVSNAFGIPAIAVDTHVFRVSHRLGLSDGKTPEAVERDLERHIPVQDRAISHHWLILHGRYICTAHRPKCGQCAIKAWCKEGPFEP